MGSSSVHVKEALVITPAEPTPATVLSLSALDSQLFLRFTIEYLLVYKTQPGLVDRNYVTARVKAALGKALVPYYPLAGRVRTRADGSGLEILCRAQGAVFIEATSDESVYDFEKAPKFVSQWRKLLSYHVSDVLKGAPPLVIQLTWLQDGNAAVGVGVNHCVCDGIGSSEFLNSFAELAKLGGGGGEIKRKEKPVWDRHLLNPAAPVSRSPRLSHPEFNRVPDLSAFSTRFSNQAMLTPTSLTIEKTRLNEMKRLAFSTTSSKFTSFEVLAAHIWRSWARSLNLAGNQTLKLLFSINIRDRVKPSLPRGFFGNAFVLGCAQSGVRDLEHRGLGYAAMLVKRAKERVDGEFVKSVVESVSGASWACPDSVGVLVLSQWSRLGLERVDFGVGRPVHVGPVCCDRYCLVLPGCDGRREAVKVMLAVPSTAVEKYECLVRSLYS